MHELKIPETASSIEFDVTREPFSEQPLAIWPPTNTVFQLAYERWFVQFKGDLSPLNIILAIDVLINVVEYIKIGQRPLTPGEKKSLVIAVILFAIDKLADDDEDKPLMMLLAKNMLSRTIDQEVAKILIHSVKSAVGFCFPCCKKDGKREDNTKPEELVRLLNEEDEKPEVDPIKFENNQVIHITVSNENNNDNDNNNENDNEMNVNIEK